MNQDLKEVQPQSEPASVRHLRLKSIFNYVALAILALTFLIHLPFFNADPPADLSGGRGAFSDEGLYTFQIRNAINHYGLGMKEYDTLIKTPLFSALLFPLYKIFGTQLFISKILVLLSLFVSVAFLWRLFQSPVLPLLICSTALLQNLVFHYSHLGMSEMMCCGFILISWVMLVKSLEDESDKWMIKMVLSAFFASVVYYTKIQFIYTLPVIPIVILALLISRWIKSKRFDRLLFRQLLYYCLFIGFFAALYYFTWYLPNRSFYNSIMNHHLKDSLPPGDNPWTQFRQNYRDYFFTAQLNPYRLGLIFAVVLSVGLLFSAKISLKVKLMLGFCMVEIALELHKFTFAYFPSRSFVSIVFFTAILISLVLYSLIQQRGLLLKIFAIGFALYFLCINIADLKRSFDTRTYVMKKVRYYLAQFDFSHSTILGSWATNLTWQTKAQLLPVSYNYFNDKDVIARFHPRMIIAEDKEGDNGQAYTKDNLSLDDHSDSVKHFAIGNFNVNLYWMRKE